MRNAPARKSQGVECQSLTNLDAHTIRAARIQYFVRIGIPSNRAILIGDLVLGEVCHG